MVSKITSEIKVSVVANYDSHNSYPSESRYVFRYNIEIQNLGNSPVRLLSRKWIIYDLGYGYTEVEGSGVIGLTPTVDKKMTFKYFSNVILKSGIGNMLGVYLFENMDTRETFEVEVPMFTLISNVLFN